MTKICIDCKSEKPLSDFNKHTAAKDGLSSFCRECHKIRNKLTAAKRSPERKALDSARLKEYRAAHPEKIAEYRARGHSKKLEYMRNKYASDAEYREQVRLYKVQYRKANPEKVKSAHAAWRAANLDASRKYHREYSADKRANDPEWHQRELNAKTIWRARNWHKESVGPGWVREVADKVVDQSTLIRLHAWQQDHCYFCNSFMKKCTLEHILPRSLGGPGVEQNLVLTCESCNYSRQDKIYHQEWLPKSVERIEDKIFLNQKTIKQILAAADVEAECLPHGGWLLKSVAGKERLLFIVSTFFGSTRNPGSDGAKTASALQKTYEDPIVLFSHEWHKRNASCVNMIKAKLGIAEKGPGARKLDIVEIPSSEASVFLDSHHVMGKVIAPIRIGLTDGATLFGLGLFHDVGEVYMCDRLAFHGHVAGGMTRIMKALWNLYGQKPIRTFVDSRYADGGGHETVGFRSLGKSAESYQWVLPDRVQHQRFLSNDNKMSRNLLHFNPEAKNEDNILANGIFKIWTPKRHDIIWEP